jgi:hypothetical protein
MGKKVTCIWSVSAALDLHAWPHVSSFLLSLSAGTTQHPAIHMCEPGDVLGRQVFCGSVAEWWLHGGFRV